VACKLKFDKQVNDIEHVDQFAGIFGQPVIGVNISKHANQTVVQLPILGRCGHLGFAFAHFGSGGIYDPGQSISMYRLLGREVAVARP
jgi:hypothetical protein